MNDAPALLRVATARLAAAGVASPRVDAELLLAHVLGVPRARLVLVGTVPADVADRYTLLISRRAERVPLQHLTGTAPFRHVELAVGPGVFIPRPETELLVDAVLPVLQSVAAPTAVDLCSGSGALALALADEVPGARVLAIEQSGTALTWLRRNAAGTSVEVIVSDVRERGLLAGLSGVVDAVVCNPPYVPQGTRVAPEVRHDPDVAVFADDDGLELIPAVAATAAALLRPDGVLALEHDDSHGDAVARLLDAAGDWTEIEEHLDLTGRPRYVTARRR